MLPPTGYKGGKRRLAKRIASEMLELNPHADWYCDLCCGSGAVLLALRAAGVPATQLYAVEAGPWGMFWRAIADGSFDIDYLKALLFGAVPDDPRDVAAWCEESVATEEISPETFLVLQAASYGSTPLWHDGTRWRRGEPKANRGYKARGYWEPGPGSQEKKPRGTIFQPEKIVERTANAMAACRGMVVVYGLLEDAEPPSQGVYYLDPPYEGATGYGYVLDTDAWIASGPRPLLVSEGRVTPKADRSYELSARRGSALTANSTRGVELLNVYEKRRRRRAWNDATTSMYGGFGARPV
jgi:hypothetical protein